MSKAESHGCIRLTNWDALQLASAVTKGVIVSFFGDDKKRVVSQTEVAKSAKKDTGRIEDTWVSIERDLGDGLRP